MEMDEEDEEEGVAADEAAELVAPPLHTQLLPS
jgi:hypothetical protein